LVQYWVEHWVEHWVQYWVEHWVQHWFEHWSLKHWVQHWVSSTGLEQHWVEHWVQLCSTLEFNWIRHWSSALVPAPGATAGTVLGEHSDLETQAWVNTRQHSVRHSVQY
jgi:hypothetical protein